MSTVASTASVKDAGRRRRRSGGGDDEPATKKKKREPVPTTKSVGSDKKKTKKDATGEAAAKKVVEDVAKQIQKNSLDEVEIQKEIDKEMRKLMERLVEFNKKVFRRQARKGGKKGAGKLRPIPISHNGDGIDIETLIDRVSLNNTYLKRLRDSVRTNPYVVSAVNMLLAQISGTGVSIVLEGLAYKLDLEGVLPSFITNEMMPFIKEMIWCQLMWGFCVVVDTESEEVAGLTVPEVARFGSWRVEFGYKGNRRIYKIFKCAKPGQAGNDVESEYKGARVYALFPPLEDGTLTSPLGNLRNEVRNLQSLWVNTIDTSDALARPEYLVETGTSGGSGGGGGGGASSGRFTFDPITNSHYAEGDLEDQQAEHARHYDEQQRLRLEMSVMGAKLLNKGYDLIPKGAGRSVNPQDREAQRRRRERHAESWEDPVILPPGQRVTQPPAANIVQQTVEFMRVILSCIANNLGIDAGSLMDDSNMHAANAELKMRNMNTTIQSVQLELVPLLNKIFQHSWIDLLGDIRAEVFDDVYRQAFEEKDFEEALDRTDLSSIFLFQQILGQEVSSRVTVSVQFNKIPLTSPDRIKELWDTGVLAHDKYAYYMMKVTGLPLTDMAPEDERTKFLADYDRERWSFKQQELGGGDTAAPTAANPSSVGNKRKRANGESDEQPSSKRKKTGKDEGSSKKHDTDMNTGVEKAEKRRRDVSKKAE